MEGLVKGLINVALGIGDEGEEGRNNQRNSSNQDRDERSRSSWAQVVSGEQDNDRPGSDHTYGYNRQEERYGRNEEFESGDPRPVNKPYKHPQPAHQRYERHEENRQDHSHWNREEGKDKNDGWETVNRKPSKQHHKEQLHTENWENYKRPASEQKYSSMSEHGFDLEPSEEELSNVSKACNKLWELDSNRLQPGKDYQIDCGEGKKVYQKADMAAGNLFTWLSEDVFRRPTFSRFCSLLDNYNPHQGSKETVTEQEIQEQLAFIEEISRTPPIKYLHKYLLSKGIVSNNYQDFKQMMTRLWFDLYGRSGTSNCSSAFEHVFVGEIKQRGEQEVSGFHNWIQFYLEEAKGKVDYQGYIFPRRRGEIPDSDTQLLTIQFEWNGVLKSVSSTLVGVSPEFEVAIYTLCYFVGGEENYVQLGPYLVNIKCYRLGDKIGSVFPVAEC